MTEKFREMKVACNSIFMSIFIAKIITDSWGIFDETADFQPT